jgi:cytochrome b
MHKLVRVWDLPVRLFHWALVVCVVGLLVTSQIAGQAMTWHFRFGYAVFTLLLFRLGWGLIGGHWSRFSSFLYSPVTLWRYLRGARGPKTDTGHTPIGALSVFAMLLLLSLQVVSGLFSDDEIAAAGPLTALVSKQVVSTATFYHTAIGKYAVLGLIVLHLLAITFYSRLRNKPLVKTMLTGDSLADASTPSSLDSAADRLRALALLLGCAASAGTLFWLL